MMVEEILFWKHFEVAEHLFRLYYW